MDLRECIAIHNAAQPEPELIDVTPLGEAIALAFRFARIVSQLDADERTAAHSLLAGLLWRPAPQDPMP